FACSYFDLNSIALTRGDHTSERPASARKKAQPYRRTGQNHRLSGSGGRFTPCVSHAEKRISSFGCNRPARGTLRARIGGHLELVHCPKKTPCGSTRLLPRPDCDAAPVDDPYPSACTWARRTSAT